MYGTQNRPLIRFWSELGLFSLLMTFQLNAMRNLTVTRHVSHLESHSGKIPV